MVHAPAAKPHGKRPPFGRRFFFVRILLDKLTACGAVSEIRADLHGETRPARVWDMARRSVATRKSHRRHAAFACHPRGARPAIPCRADALFFLPENPRQS